MDFSKMSGYEFEDYIAQMLRQNGFNVTQTSYSNDGGVDMIALLDKPLFSGKYIVQCKNYTGLVGQPEIRDLYGVVMAESANKGILITPSDFTEQAYDFARGKQLELINGKTLQFILFDTQHEKPTAIKEKSFIDADGFNKSRYEYLKRKIEETPKEESYHRGLFDLLHGYMLCALTNNEFEKCNTSFFKETIAIVKSWKDRCYKEKAKDIERTMCDLLISDLLMISGEAAQAVELLISCGSDYYSFSEYEELWPYIAYAKYDPWEHVPSEIEHRETNLILRPYTGRHILAFNAYVLFKSVGFQRGMRIITKNLKPIESAKDYFVNSFNVQGIHNMLSLEDDRHIPLSSYDQVPSKIKWELEQFCQWYQRFICGQLDDVFLVTNIGYEFGRNRKKYLFSQMNSFQESTCSFSKIKSAYYKKTDIEICTELDSVFDNHGL